MRKLLLLTTTLFLLFNGFVANAQLDTKHYIPPMHARVDPGQGGIFLLLSTPQTDAFDVTVTDGAGNLLYTQQISQSAPATINFGTGGTSTKFLVSSAQLASVLSDEGLILTANKAFFASVRVVAGAQGASMTSKGTAGFGTEFRSGHIYNTSGATNRKAHIISFMATEDDTEVVVSEYDDGAGNQVEFEGFGGATPSTITVNLDEGESYVLAAYADQGAAANLNDVNGTRISSDKPIAVNTGSWLGGSPGGTQGGRDIGIDQIASLEETGFEYILVKGEGSTNENVIVVAGVDGTEIFLNGSATPSATLNAGDYHRFDVTAYTSSTSGENMHISSNQPVYVYQGLNGAVDSNEKQVGMNFIPPIVCLGGTNVDISDVDQLGSAVLQIIAEKEFNSNPVIVTVNGVDIPTGDQKVVDGNSNYVTYKLTGYTGDVSVESERPLRVALANASGAVGAAGFFSGFTTAPVVESPNGYDASACIPENVPVELTAAGFDSYQWYRNGIKLNGETNASLFVDAPGNYSAKGILAGCQSSEQSFSLEVALCPADVGIAKNEVSVDNVSGSIFDVTYDLYVENFSSANDADNVQIIENINSGLPSGATAVLQSAPQVISGSFSQGGINPSFDGDAVTQMLQIATETKIDPSQIVVIRFVVRIDMSGASFPTYTNQAIVSTKDVGPNDGSNPDQQDFSTGGTDPDPNGNGDPTDTDENETTQTCVSNTTIQYDSPIYYTTGSNPTPDIIGFTGGDFSAPSEITIDQVTGEINLSESIVGTYEIEYSFGGLCPDVTTVTIALNPPAEPTVVAQTANTFTPTITGSAVIEAGETLFVTVEGQTYELGVDPELTISGTTWSLALPAGVITMDGTYDVDAVIDDGVGGTTPDTTSGELVIDSSGPGVDIQGEPAIVNSTDPYTVTIQFDEDVFGFDITDINIGNGSASSFVKVDNNTFTVVVTPNGSGDITIDVPAGSAQDGAGNASTAAAQASTVYDDIPPAVPTSDSQTTNNTSPVITGTTGTGAALQPGETMEVTINGATYVVTPAADGSWSIDTGVDTPDSGTLGAFTDGSYEVVASVTDEAGNVSTDATSNELVIDTSAPTVPIVDSKTTNDTSPVITGSTGTGAALPAGETMEVMINGATYDVIPDADGKWSIDLETATPSSGTLGAFVDGISYDIEVTVTDEAGNSITDATTNELTIDTTAPATPSITNETICEGDNLVIEGTTGTGSALNAGENLEVEINGATYAVIPDGAGDWSVDTGADTPASGTLGAFAGGNDYTITARITDNAGNESSTTGTATIVAIPSVSLVSSADPSTCGGSDGEINLSFTDVPNGSYTIDYVDDLSNPQSILGVNVTSGTATLTVSEGTYNDISITISGCQSTGNVDVVLSDPAIPTIAVNSSTNPTTCGGNGTIELAFTNVVDGSYTITHAAGSFNNVSVNGGAATISTGDGTYTDLSITVNDCSSVEDPDVTLTEPTPPTISFVQVNDPTTCSGTDGSVEITGLNASTSYTVDYEFEGSSVSTTITSDGTGNLEIGGLGAGNVTNVSVTAAGCTSNTLTGPFILNDPVTATIAVQSSSDPTTCAGADGQIVLSGFENSLAYDLTYKADGATVTVNGISSEADGTLIISGLSDGNYTDFQVTKNGCVSNQVDGPVTLADPTPPTISSTVGTDPSTCANTDGEIDLNGLNDLDTYDVTYTKSGTTTTINGVSPTGGTYVITNLTAGTYTNISVLEIGSGCQSNIIPSLVLTPPDIVLGITSDPTTCGGTEGTIQITGLAENTTYDLNYELDGVAATTVSITSDADGEYIVSGLTAGAYTLMNVTDAGGCVSNDLATTLNDPPTPTITLGTTSDPSTCGGNDGSIQITGLEATTLYTVRYFTTSSISQSLTSDGSGNITISGLSAESYTGITATINNCTSNALATTLNDPPSPTVVLGSNPEVCFGEANTQLTYSGPTNNPNKYQLDFDAIAEGEGFTDVLNATLGASPINISVPTDAAPAVYNATFRVINTTTGCETDYPITLTVNPLPTVPTVDFQVTNNTTPTITGSADAGNNVVVEVAGAIFNTVATGGNTWTIDTNTPDAGTFAPNVNGANEVIVTVNDGTCENEDATSNELIIDTTDPEVPEVFSQITNDPTPVIRGTAEPGSTVTVQVGGATYEVTADGSGNWTIDTETLAPTSGTFAPDVNGANEVIVESTDAAGNSTFDITNLELTIDTTDPVAPTVESQTTVDTTPVLNGTAEPGSQVQVEVGGATYLVVADASGNWSVDTETATPASGTFAPDTNGSNEVVVTSTDAAGNSSVDTSTLELTILTGDSDGDGILDVDEDIDGDGDPTNDDSDGDGTPDYLDEDDDGDGVNTIDEDVDGDGDPTNDDTDGDGTPDYLDEDDDGDGINTEDEDIDGDGDPTNDDTDGDGTPDYLDEDDDGDGINTEDEDIDGDGDPTNDDSDGDGTPDYLDEDDDGDGVNTIDEDVDGDGDPTNDDTDGDGTPDYLDEDDDGDGINTEDEDIDGDGDPTNDDTDGDGTPDYLDEDDDGDGINTEDEDIDGDGDPTNDDSDGDGTPDYLDEDDDGDGINTEDEDLDGDGDPTNDDCDNDGTPNYLDTDYCDSDGDGILDNDEDTDGDGDFYNDDCDNDGTPNFLDPDACDTDGDGLDDEDEDTDGDGDPYNDDCDEDGIPNFQDPDTCDTDGDGVLDEDEDTNGDGDLNNDDCDEDGIPNYLDTDVCEAVTPRKGFTPDGDGINDFFFIKDIEFYPNNNVQIYNRWGNKIFEINGYDNQSRVWSSEVTQGLTYGDRVVPDGTYYYLINLGDGSKPISGFVVVNK
ncbi:Ig-like domain-containing protein [Ekhidna sp.]|uniref:Ig-like domain-containing protein n=1 Tax=Ekhidna sp. TaxID=2608089 RepID=UPI00351867BA